MRVRLETRFDASRRQHRRMLCHPQSGYIADTIASGPAPHLDGLWLVSHATANPVDSRHLVVDLGRDVPIRIADEGSSVHLAEQSCGMANVDSEIAVLTRSGMACWPHDGKWEEVAESQQQFAACGYCSQPN